MIKLMSEASASMNSVKGLMETHIGNEGVIEIATSGKELRTELNYLSAMEKDATTLDRVSAGLESIAISIESSVVDLSMENSASLMCNSAVKALYSQLGVSVEEVSVEGIKNTIEDIFKAVKEAIKKIMKTIYSFFGKMFGSLTYYEKRLALLKKRAEDLAKFHPVSQHGPSPIGTIKIPKTIVTNRTTGVHDLIHDVTNLANVSTEVQEVILTSADSRNKALLDFLLAYDIKDKSKDNLKDAYSKLVSEISDIGHKLRDNVDWYQSKTGSKEFIIREDKAVIMDDMYYDDVTIKFGESTDVKPAKSDLVVDCPNPHEIIEIISVCSKLLETIKSSNGAVSKLNGSREKVIEEAEKVFVLRERKGIAGKLDKAVNGDSGNLVYTDQKVNPGARVVLKAVQNNLLSALAGFDAYALAYMRAHLEITEESMKRYLAL